MKGATQIDVLYIPLEFLGSMCVFYMCNPNLRKWTFKFSASCPLAVLTAWHEGKVGKVAGVNHRSK